MAKTKSKKSAFYPSRASDVPVTQKMFYGVRDELISLFRSELKFESRSLRSELKSESESLRAELRSESKSIRAELQLVKNDVALLKAQVVSIQTGMEAFEAKMTSQFHHLTVLVEEQNAKNNIVLDGLVTLFHRQDRVEEELANQRKLLAGLK